MKNGKPDERDIGFAEFENIPPGVMIWFDEMYKAEKRYKRAICVLLLVIAVMAIALLKSV